MKPDYKRHIFNLSERKKSYDIYLLNAEESFNQNLPFKVRIEPFKGKSLSKGISVLLIGHNGRKWVTKPPITGLRPFKVKGRYYGDDFTGKKNLLFIEIVPEESKLIIDYFNSFYPLYPSMLHQLAEAHKWYTKRGGQ